MALSVLKYFTPKSCMNQEGNTRHCNWAIPELYGGTAYKGGGRVVRRHKVSANNLENGHDRNSYQNMGSGLVKRQSSVA